MRKVPPQGTAPGRDISRMVPLLLLFCFYCSLSIVTRIQQNDQCSSCERRSEQGGDADPAAGLHLKRWMAGEEPPLGCISDAAHFEFEGAGGPAVRPEQDPAAVRFGRDGSR
ncbi:hypothetical protein, partial [Paenibacillus sp. KR2-11]|uniref:hypothetical protein n=1 Tax=Paenibacillus sp. KR2-11 TaxID=3385500 RepID=UPI0038FCF3A0